MMILVFESIIFLALMHEYHKSRNVLPHNKCKLTGSSAAHRLIEDNMRYNTIENEARVN